MSETKQLKLEAEGMKEETARILVKRNLLQVTGAL